MRKTQFAGAVATIGLGLVLTACGGSNDMNADAPPSTAMMATSAPMMSTMMSAPAMTATGAFAGLNGKSVAGSATLTGSTVDLSGFASDEGPDLYLYLTKGTTEADVKAGARLGSIRYDRATQQFTLPDGASAAGYTHLVVHCDKALAVFGAAQLNR